MVPLPEVADADSVLSIGSEKNLKTKIHSIGPYQLLETLGIGEFGKVKLAHHVDTHQKVAIKMIDKSYTEKANIRDKVEREIALLKRLSHPSIIKLFDVIETERYIGMVMEYASGGELFEYILNRDYLEEDIAKEFFGQLISSVHYMHQKGVVHRDLKLENVLLFDDKGHIVITDFGFANNCTGQEDLLKTCCGSPCYAAPELLVGTEYVGPAVDIWSCGVVLYAMVCGFLPFDDHHNMSLLYKDMLEAPLMFPPRISQECRDLLRQMLEPNPDNRCKMEFILQHPWLENQKFILEKSIETLESEAKEMLQSNFFNITTATITPSPAKIVVDDDKEEEEEEEEKTDDDQQQQAEKEQGKQQQIQQPVMQVASTHLSQVASPLATPKVIQTNDNIPKLQLTKRQRFFRWFYLNKKNKDTQRRATNSSSSSDSTNHNTKQRRRFTWSLSMRRGDRKRKNRESNHLATLYTRVHPESLLVFTKINDHQMLTLILRVLTLLGIHSRQHQDQNQIECIRRANDDGTIYGNMETCREVTFMIDFNNNNNNNIKSIGIRHQTGEELAYGFLCGKIMDMLELLLDHHHHHH